MKIPLSGVKIGVFCTLIPLLSVLSDPFITVSAVDDSIVEGDALAWTLGRIGTTAGDIDVTIAITGNLEDVSGLIQTFTIPDGQSEFPIANSTNADGIYEGCEVALLTISGVSGASAQVGTPSSAAIAVFDSNNHPIADENLEQTVVGVPLGNSPLHDIVVSDPDASYLSTYDTTSSTALYHYTGQGNLAVFTDGRPDDDFAFDLDSGSNPPLAEAPGFALALDFIPQAGDLSGTAMIWEIGDSSSGSAVFLLEGIPHLLVKCGGTDDDAPTDDGSLIGAFTDLNWGSPNASANGTDDTVVVPLATGPALPGLPARIAVSFDITGDTVSYSVNGATVTTVNLVGRDSTNWLGDPTTANFQVNGSIGGTNNVAGTPFNGSGTGLVKSPIKGFSSASCARLWNESSGTLNSTPGSPDTITATLAIQSPNELNGTISALSSTGGGVFEVSGNVPAINAALAAAEYVDGGATTFPVAITVTIMDAAGATTTGDIVVLGSAPSLVFVDDDFSGPPLTAIPDADGGSATTAATFKVDAFTNFETALGVLASGGTILANDGNYPEGVALTDTSVSLLITDSAGGVAFESLISGPSDSVQIRVPNFLSVGSDGSPSFIAGPISDGGGLTKTGTGALTLTNSNPTFTGTATIDQGILRLGDNSTVGALDGDGPIVVNSSGELQFRPPVNLAVNQTGPISGDGIVSAQGDGTLIFNNPGANTFTGGFNLGDGEASTFDGDGAGTMNGFVIVTRNDHLGTGSITARGSQLRAGSSGLNIPNPIDVANGGLRTGGPINFTLSGSVKVVGGTRVFGNYGLGFFRVVVSGPVDLSEGGIQIEGSDGKNNGEWRITGDISGPGGLDIRSNFDLGAVRVSGNNTYTGTTDVRTGSLQFDASHTGGGPYTVFSGASMDSFNGNTDASVTVNAGGSIRPGVFVSATLHTGDLAVHGTLKLGVNNTAAPPGIGFTHLVVNGSVDVSTATFEFSEFGSEVSPQAITFISNDGIDPVLPGFSGLPDGATAVTGYRGSAFDAIISYSGGTGNDVVLDVINPLDPDGDFITTLLENAFDTDPGDKTSGREGLPAVSRAPDGSIVSIRWRELDSPGIKSYTPQISTDGAKTWLTAPGTPVMAGNQSNATSATTIWELDINVISSADLVHLRLLVEE